MSGTKSPFAASPAVFWEYLEVLVVIALITVGGWFIPLSYRAFGTIYLLAVIRRH